MSPRSVCCESLLYKDHEPEAHLLKFYYEYGSGTTELCCTEGKKPRSSEFLRILLRARAAS